MPEALTDQVAPETDELTEQAALPNPVEVKSEPKSLDDTLKEAVEKTVDKKPEADAEKLKDDQKKPDDKGKVEAKPEKEEKPKAEADDDDDPDDDGQKPEPKAEKPKHTAFKEPPRGFNEVAKREWESVPESVRIEMHRRSQEMENGIHRYKQDAEQFESVREYADLAKRSGTDLPTALSRYVGLEQKLRQDPMGGLQDVVANLGLKKPDGSQVTLRDVAAKIMGQSPDEAASRQEATINQLTRQVQELTQQLGGFSKHVEQQQQQARTASVESEWNSFQQERPAAASLENEIAEFLTRYPANNIPVKQRLDDAYNWAIAQNPNAAHTGETPLVQTQTPEPAQNREKPRAVNPAGQKSISGTGGESRSVRKMSTDDALKKAIAKMNG